MSRMLGLNLSCDSAILATLLLHAPAASQPVGLNHLDAPHLDLRCRTTATKQDPKPTNHPHYDTALIAANQFYALQNVTRFERAEPDPAWQARMTQSLSKSTGVFESQLGQTSSPDLDYALHKFVDLYYRSTGTLNATDTLLAISRAAAQRRMYVSPFAGSDAANFATDFAVTLAPHPVIGVSLLVLGTGVSTAIKHSEQEELEKISVAMRLASKPEVRQANYRAMEVIAKERPDLYDSIVSAIAGLQEHGTPLVGIAYDTQEQVAVTLPPRSALTDPSSGVYVPSKSAQVSLITKGARNQLTEKDQQGLTQVLVELAERAQDTVHAQQEFLKAAKDSSTAEANLVEALKTIGISAEEAAALPESVRKLSAFVALGRANEAERAKREEFDKAAEQAGLLLSRLDPRAGRVFSATSKLYSKLAENSALGKTKLSTLTNLSNFLSITNLSLAIVDAVLGGKDPTQAYFERIDELLTQLDKKLDGVSSQIANLHQDMLREFQTVNVTLGEARWEVRFWGEVIYRELQTGLTRLEELNRRQIGLLQELVEQSDLIVHGITIVDQKVDVLQDSVNRIESGISDLGLAANLVLLRSELDPNRATLSAEKRKTLFLDIVKLLPTIASLRSRAGHLATINPSQAAELHTRDVSLTDFSRQSGALARYLSVRTMRQVSADDLYDVPFLREGLLLVLNASGQNGFPTLDQDQTKRLSSILEAAQIAQHRLAMATITTAADLMQEELAKVNHSRAEFRQAREASIFPNYRYELGAPAASLQAVADGAGLLVPEFPIGATIGSAGITSRAVSFKGIVENSHWYQNGFVKVKREVGVRNLPGASHISGPIEGEPARRTIEIDEYQVAGSCGGPAEMKWKTDVSANITLRTGSNTALALNKLLLPAGMQKLQLQGSLDFLRLSEGQTTVTTEDVKALGAKHTGNSGNTKDRPFKAGKLIFFRFTQTHQQTLRPQLHGVIGSGEALATYHIEFRGKAPTSVKIDSGHFRYYRLDRYIRYLVPAHEWDKTGTKFESERTLPGAGVEYNSGGATSQAMELDIYYSDVNQVLNTIGQPLRDAVVKEKGEAWTDGISTLSINTGKLVGNVGLFKANNKTILRVGIAHRVEGQIYLDVELPANYTAPSTLPALTLDFAIDFRELRTDDSSGISSNAVVQQLQQREKSFHFRQVKRYVLDDLKQFFTPGTALQQSLENIVAAELLVRKSLETFGSEFKTWDIDDCLTRGKPLTDTVAYKLGGLDNSILSLRRELQELQLRADRSHEKEPIELEATRQLLNDYFMNIKTLLGRIQAFEKSGRTFHDPQIETLLRMLKS